MDEMNVARIRDMKNAHRNFVGKCEEKRQLESLIVDGRLIIKVDLKEIVGGLDSAGSG
jgi:hypothetical protein